MGRLFISIRMVANYFNIFLLQDGGGIVRFLFSLERRIDGEKTNYKLDAVLIPTTGCIEVNKFMLLGLHHQNK